MIAAGCGSPRSGACGLRGCGLRGCGLWVPFPGLRAAALIRPAGSFSALHCLRSPQAGEGLRPYSLSRLRERAGVRASPD
ncbi:hypothetical protein LC55x_2052 [Lysobacter capsici]|nr:hypothetical protein LC55x_2052 [Lysobacter capsici]